MAFDEVVITHVRHFSARYEKPLMDFIEHLGTRADLPLRALTSKDVRSFRDAEIKTGKSPVTVNLTHKTIAGALFAAVRQGYILNNPAAAVDYLPTHEDRGEKGLPRPCSCSRTWSGSER